MVERTKDEVVIADYPWFYGSFWRRLGAWFIDYIIFGIITFISILPFSAAGTSGAPWLMLWFILIFAYFIGFWIWRGQTLGKIALGVKIVQTDGKPIGLGKALLRFFIGYPISSIILCLGFLWIAFDERKQGIHDKITNTYVITKRGETLAKTEYAEYMQKMKQWESDGYDVARLKECFT